MARACIISERILRTQIPRYIWHLGPAEHSEQLWQVSNPKRLVFQEERHLRIISTARPSVSDNLAQDPLFEGKLQARELRLISGLGVPVMAGTEVIAICEFFAREAIHLDPLFLEMVANAGVILGNTIERKQMAYLLRDLSGRLLKLQDDERRDLARELHDTTAQNISAVIMNLDMIEMSAGDIAPATRTALCECAALARQSLHEIRTFSYLLHPPMLDEFGLLQAIRIFVDDFSRGSGIQVDLEIPQSFVAIPKDLEVTLFRVLQEGLLNVYRHSNSRAARVEVELDPINIRMKVENRIGGSTAPLSEGDSGKSEVPVKIGVGIAGMRERVGQFGGQLALSRQDDRAILDVTLPICQTT